jgi:hypothetical protein
MNFYNNQYLQVLLDFYHFKKKKIEKYQKNYKKLKKLLNDKKWKLVKMF